MAINYFPTLSSIVSTDQLPEELDFLTDFLDDILDNIHYRNFVFDKSFDGSAASYRLDIVSYSKLLRFEIPGTGLVFILNPDLNNSTTEYSIIPFTLSWNLGVIQFLKNFQIKNFSFQPEAFIDIIFQMVNLSETELLVSLIDNVIDAPNPLDSFVTAANSKYANLNIPYPLNSDFDLALTETVDAIKNSTDTSLDKIPPFAGARVPRVNN